MEALQYNSSFSLSQYFILICIFLVIISLFYYLYYLLHQFEFSESIFRFYKDFIEQKIESLKFYEMYKKASVKIFVLINIILNNFMAYLIMTIPITIIIGLFITIFKSSHIFDVLPVYYMQKTSDFQDTTDPAVQKLILANIVSRLGLAILLLGFCLLIIGGFVIRPEPIQEIIDKKLVDEMGLKLANTI